MAREELRGCLSCGRELAGLNSLPCQSERMRTSLTPKLHPGGHVDAEQVWGEKKGGWSPEAVSAKTGTLNHSSSISPNLHPGGVAPSSNFQNPQAAQASVSPPCSTQAPKGTMAAKGSPLGRDTIALRGMQQSIIPWFAASWGVHAIGSWSSKTLALSWDLPTVLDDLLATPFEPLVQVKLKMGALKTAFLRSLNTSGWDS